MKSDSKKPGKTFNFAGAIILLLASVLTIFPLLQCLLISIKPVGEFMMDPLGLPRKIRLQNYVDAWIQGDLGLLFLNTIIVTASTIAAVIAIASPAGFALSKLRIKGAKWLYNYFLLGIIIPFQAIMIPLMRFAGITGMTNKLSTLVLIFTGTNLSLPILIYTGFYKSIPMEIVEAARIDGCGVIKLFIKIIFPLTTAVNMTVAIFTGKVPWSDFFIPLVFTNDKSARTLPFGLFSFQTQYFSDWTLTFAMSVIISIPLILFYVFAQKSFMQGITAGSVKA